MNKNKNATTKLTTLYANSKSKKTKEVGNILMRQNFGDTESICFLNATPGHGADGKGRNRGPAGEALEHGASS